jgi:RNA polymerase sigma-70 factor (ECF subfamily)
LAKSRSSQESDSEDDEESLLRRLAEGDRAARERLFRLYRPRLRRAIQARLGTMERPGIDPSDIVQTAMQVATKRLGTYLNSPAIPFFPWLYVLTFDQLKKALGKIKVRSPRMLSDESSARIADILVHPDPSPSEAAMRGELCRSVRQAMESMNPTHREILVMHYDEGLKLSEIAIILGIEGSAAKMRHLRAIQEMKRLLGDSGREFAG